ncbi:MAG: ATP-binding protein [Vicinamibacterales bacterium]|jgi:signal transduction histidine kinase/CheY-like chemotaxis protein
MPPSPSSAVTRAIFFGTVAALLVVATLSVVIYRSAVGGAIAQHSTQQLAMVRTASVGIQGEIRGLSALLRQFNSLPSVQNLDIPFLGQRIEAAFGDNPIGVVRYIVRIDAEGRLYYWEPGGRLIENGTRVGLDPERWRWNGDPANRGKVTIARAWWLHDAPDHVRVISTPVWRTSPSGENPNPRNDFNGMLGLAIDVNRLVEVYLGPAIAESAADQLVVGLTTPEYGVRMGPGQTGLAAEASDAHRHDGPQGIAILGDGNGRRIHAWSRLTAADQTWLAASSSQYDLVAAQFQRNATGQLALTAVLLVILPLAGWLLARRERRTQEGQRQLERQLAESQKMEAIGKLAGGVAHDFNNMLTAILGYASLIHEDAPADSPIRDQALQIRRAADSAAALTHKLLAFSRRQVLQTNQFDFAAMLDNLLMLVRRVMGEDIKVIAHAEPGLWPVLADPAQVEQSILNLAINAREAMPGGGTLQITARNAARPLGERRPDGDVRPGNYVQITVTDTGTGMDEATRARMFEPFFTTKPHGKGTGLGLSTVYGFVRQCGGHIGVTSTLGAGTAIELLLPRAPDQPAPTPTPKDLTPPRVKPDGPLETVLVVEDEDAVRLLAAESLRRGGYVVIAAASGEEALRVADAFEGTIHLLLSDVVMPGMKGPALAARLRAARPSIRVILMSGYAADVVTPDDLKAAMLLSKPFSAGVLAKAVRRVLDEALSPGPLPKG